MAGGDFETIFVVVMWAELLVEARNCHHNERSIKAHRGPFLRSHALTEASEMLVRCSVSRFSHHPLCLMMGSL
jgi:hypothetical protein